jgi:hypothetical protein
MSNSADERRAGPPARTPTEQARAELLRALGAVESGDRNSLERMRGALCAYVHALRDDGASKEQVIEIIRSIVATPTTASARFGLLHPARVALVELSVSWCDEEYEAWRPSGRRSGFEGPEGGVRGTGRATEGE